MAKQIPLDDEGLTLYNKAKAKVIQNNVGVSNLSDTKAIKEVLKKYLQVVK